jgi:site-specific DNA recombinase
MQSDHACEPCASYSRYSSEHQREESITDQQRKCHESAKSNGHAIAPELEFYDQAVSGTKLHREGLDKMLAAAEAGKFSTLYFYSVSRLARESVISMPLLKKLVHVHRVRIISVTEGIDSSRDGWELLASILGVMAERYVKDLGVSSFRGQEGAILAGFSVGDHCFGYKSVPIAGSENGRKGRNAKPHMTYVIDERTAPWVFRIFHWFVVELRSVRWITRELNRLGAPKDHRSTTKTWHHQQVTDLLKRTKYVGKWPWGQMQNVRDPFTGKVSQENRPAEECEKWTRDFTHLRIISDEVMAAAQARLGANERKQEQRRQPDGRLAGSATGNSQTHPRHLLSGLLRCELCGAAYHVTGAGARYMHCPNYAKGVCTNKTQVRRDLAERMILDAISQRIIANQAWQQAVFDYTLATWRREAEQQPSDLQNAEKALADVKRKIKRLLDMIEGGSEEPDLNERLAQRSKERDALANQCQQLQASAGAPRPEPTLDWVAQQIEELSKTLHSEGPAAALALRNLVGGQVVVREVQRPGRQRHLAQGNLILRSSQVARSAGLPADGLASGSCTGVNDLMEEVVLDFREPETETQIADQVKALWDEGLTQDEIAARVGWNRNLVTKALAWWHRQRGLEPPDGRSCRKRLKRPTLPEQLADPAKDLWDQKVPVQDIAVALDCNRDTVTKAVKHGFQSRGLEFPDGRARRTTLPHKPSGGTTDAAVRGETSASMPSSTSPGRVKADQDQVDKPEDAQDLDLARR